MTRSDSQTTCELSSSFNDYLFLLHFYIFALKLLPILTTITAKREERIKDEKVSWLKI